MIRALRCLTLGMAWTAIWPAYLGLLAVAARRGPWPRSVAVPAASVLSALALAALALALLRWIFRPSGWAVCYLDMPEALAGQVAKAGRSLVVLAIALLLPAYLLAQGEIAPDARPVVAPAISRFLVIAFELAACVYLVRISRRGAVPKVADEETLTVEPDGTDRVAEASPYPGIAGSPPIPGALQDVVNSNSIAENCLHWLERRRRLVPWFSCFVVLAIIGLEARGYSFSSRRLAVGLSQSALVIAVCWAFDRVALKAIKENTGKWASGSAGSWTRTLTSAVASQAGTRFIAGLTPSRVPVHGLGLHAPASTLEESKVNIDQTDFLTRRVRQLSGLGMAILGGLALSWVWDLDWVLVKTVAAWPLPFWPIDVQAGVYVTLGEVAKAMLFVLMGVVAWRHINPLFAVFVFPRMPDDPGARYAVVTLCRYLILGLTAILALGAIHLDMAKIGVVVAALGVGLGFGLQEVVSNFVCGIILLLERPIRIGDTVTVAGTSGTVDRINIRATTIINSDNQSMIVPNREFITGNLVNWTYRDKVIRVPIRIGVAYGTDPDKVVDLLMAIARADADVLRNPVPAAQMEAFGESALLFALYTYVPDPCLVGRVRHRLCAEIHRRFAEENIQIPFPTRELHLSRIPNNLARALQESRGHSDHPDNRIHGAGKVPPGSHLADAFMKLKPVTFEEDFRRGVDE